MPLVGVDVLVSDADGAAVGLYTTDGAGEVHVDIPAGGSVSYAELAWDSPYLSSVFDVPDGSTVAFTSYRFLATDTQGYGAVYELTVSATGSPGSVVSWYFYTRCDGVSANTPGPFLLSNEGCEGHDTDQALVIGFDAESRIVAWGADFDLPLDHDLTLAVPLDQTAVESVDVEVVNVPSGFDRVDASLSGSHPDWRTHTDQIIFPDLDDTATTLEIPALGSYDLYTIGGYASRGQDESVSTMVVTRELPSQRTLDAQAMALISLDPLDVDDPAHLGISWALTPGPVGDIGYVNLGWSSGTADYGSWSAQFDPAAHMGLRMPALPPEWAEYAPDQPTDFGGSAWFGDMDFYDGYADYLAGGDWPETYVYSSTAAWGYAN